MIFNHDPFHLRESLVPGEQLELMKKRSKRLAQFYKNQNELIESFLSPFYVPNEEEKRNVKLAVHLSLAANVFLFLLQLAAAIQSGSIALYATTADACMDIVSSLILVFTSKAANDAHSFLYPTGKRRVEAAGIMIFSVFMCSLSLQLIVEAIRTLTGDTRIITETIWVYICVGTALGLKFALGVYCFLLRHHPTARVLYQDHRNDLILNGFGVGMALLSKRTFWWIDPASAIIIALVILVSWYTTAYEQATLLVGKVASKEFHQQATYITITHDPRILAIDTCRAYHVGHEFFVEVDILLERMMPLEEAHDIGETLQEKLEQLKNVDRAFVHLDYECMHEPEHKRKVD